MKRFLIVIILLSSLCSFAQVGIGTTTPLSTLDVNGNLSVKHVVLVGGATPTLIDDGVYISVSPAANDQDFQLPSASAFPGRVYIIRNVQDTINADIVLSPADVLAGVLFFAGDSSTGFPGPVNMDSGLGGGHRNKTLIFISDGSNWTYGILGF
ncbi:hypothetical protein [Psychroserpens jangbogonensis]|uniref:hypothetical protein n=1 Tax=Psychroserpens jangbogonensis TaxID=1484460 RepID=UPI00053DC001|nr:hypothetical protein [Psychroserpens jangbogonensis]